MTTIRATCPSCGEVDLTPEQIVLTIVRGDGETVGPDSYYSFECPDCFGVVEKPADERIAHLLTTGGVEVMLLHESDLDDELAELTPLPPHPEAPPAGPVLTSDDLIDLHFLLSSEGWFDQLTALAR